MSGSCYPKNFYRAFEEKFRGPRELIKLRLQIYLPFILPLRQYWSDAQAVDLGCGRGEWLELLTEHGFDAQGADLDDDMLAACRELNLKVSTADALSFLRDLPDNSQAIVSGFHIAEHLPFSVLQEFVSQALRVLKPAGLLILETPNPENLVVSTSSFYLDPTHMRPLPPLLLSFLTEFTGFKRNEIVRLQESKDLVDTPNLSLLAVLNGASPDYAVIAQKDGPEELFAALNSAFDTEYGLTLDKLADTYQQQAEEKAQQAEEKAQQAEEKAQQAEEKAQQAEEKAQQAEVKAQQAEEKAQQAEEKAQQAEEKAQQAEEKAQQAEEKAQQLKDYAKRIEACTTKVNAELESTRQELHVVHQANHHHWQLSELRQQQIDALLSSRSWRITAPLRWAGHVARWFVQGSIAWFTFAPASRPRRVARQALISLRQYVISRPQLKARALRCLAPFPSLKNRLKRVGVIPDQPTSSFIVQGPEHLSPRARQIYHDLQAAIAQHKRGQQ